MTETERKVREVLTQTINEAMPLIGTYRKMQAEEKHYQRKYYVKEIARLREQIDSIVKTGFDKIADIIDLSDEEVSKELFVSIIRIAIGTYKNK